MLILILIFPLGLQAQITYVGSASNPTDAVAATLGGPSPVAVTPVAGLVAGDLVVIVSTVRNTTAVMAISVTGGQEWYTETQISNTNIGSRLFWCRFNGTWAANPSVSFANLTATTVVMHAFRPTKSSNFWGIEAARTELDFTAPASPFTVTITGRTTRNASTVTIASWFTADDNTWGTLAGTGWVVLGSAQYRNTNGTDNSCTFAYTIKTTSGATNNVSKNQATLGGDLGTTQIITFFERGRNMPLGNYY
ncbi:MAG: hypothetical protein EPO58_04140 [Chitinophagaceae bacterium]|nr:MAG: hypothetical protein EPO58_04140 [Chitinophagaceae bacterium]